MKTKSIDLKKALTNIYTSLYDAFGPQHWWPGDTPFEVSVGAILTQNTNWRNVEKAISNLREAGALNANTLSKMPLRRLAALIKPAGYFNVKARRLHNFLAVLCNDFHGHFYTMKSMDTKSLRKTLLLINGIGPETADSILLYALEKPVFVVDTYTKRVLKRHGIISGDLSYHDTQEVFHKNIPPEIQFYNEFHALFVRVGKEYCKPQPRCKDCPLISIRRTEKFNQ